MPTFSRSYTAVAATTLTAANFNANWDALTTFLNVTGLDSSNIQALSITNALVSTTAAIAVSKLAAGTANQVLINNATPTPAWTTLSGDVTNVLGVMSIGAGKVTNAMLAGSIAYSNLSLTGAILNADLAGSIAYSKLSLTGAILNADLAGSIAYSKLTLTNSIVAGDLTSSSVTTAKINANAVTPAKIDSTAFVGSNTSTDASPASAGNTTVATTSVTPAVASYLLLFWSGRIQSNGSGHWGRLFITVDGTEQTAIGDAYFQNNTSATCVANVAATGRIALTAAAHTINLVYTPDGASNTAVAGAKFWGVLVAQ